MYSKFGYMQRMALALHPCHVIYPLSVPSWYSDVDDDYVRKRLPPINPVCVFLWLESLVHVAKNNTWSYWNKCLLCGYDHFHVPAVPPNKFPWPVNLYMYFCDYSSNYKKKKLRPLDGSPTQMDLQHKNHRLITYLFIFKFW